MSPYHTKKWRTSEVEGRSNKRERYSGGVEKRSPKLTILLFKEEHQQGHWPSRSKRHTVCCQLNRAQDMAPLLLSFSSLLGGENSKRTTLKSGLALSWKRQTQINLSWSQWRCPAGRLTQHSLRQKTVEQQDFSGDEVLVVQQLCESAGRFWGPSSEGNYRVLLFSFLHSQPYQLPMAESLEPAWHQVKRQAGYFRNQKSGGNFR